MKENDKNAERFVEKIMASTQLETPSPDFTSKLMAQISVSEPVKTKVYQPLISKWGWMGICSLIAIVILFSAFGNTEKTTLELPFVSKLSNLVPTVKISDTTSYAILIVTVMVLVQISVLKKYFDSRIKI